MDNKHDQLESGNAAFQVKLRQSRVRWDETGVHIELLLQLDHARTFTIVGGFAVSLVYCKEICTYNM